MNKSELIAEIAAEAQIPKTTAAAALDATLVTIIKNVAKGETVTLVGFGTFKRAERAARVGKNPKTGAVLNIAARKTPRFTAGTAFKLSVNPVKPGKAKK